MFSNYTLVILILGINGYNRFKFIPDTTLYACLLLHTF